MLRVEVIPATRACATDWAGNGRWKDLVELEENVGMYAENNLEWLGDEKKENRGASNDKSEPLSEEEVAAEVAEAAVRKMEFLNRWRRKAFPYESIISNMVREALSGENPRDQRPPSAAEKTNEDIIEEIKTSVNLMSSAGKVVHSMVSASSSPSVPASLEEVVTDNGLLCPHGTYRLLVSGWFLILRRAGSVVIPEDYTPPVNAAGRTKDEKYSNKYAEADGKGSHGYNSVHSVEDVMKNVAYSGAVEGGTSAASLHHRVFGADPAEEAYLWLRRWIAHYKQEKRTQRKIKVSIVNDGSDREGVLSSDEQLVLAIVKIVEQSKWEYKEEKAAKLEKIAMKTFFPKTPQQE